MARRLFEMRPKKGGIVQRVACFVMPLLSVRGRQPKAGSLERGFSERLPGELFYESERFQVVS